MNDGIIDCLIRNGVAESKGEVLRLIKQGAVRIKVGKTKIVTVTSADVQDSNELLKQILTELTEINQNTTRDHESPLPVYIPTDFG